MRKRFSLISVLLTIILLTALNGHALAMNTTDPVLRHVVLFKFSDKASAAEVKAIEESFRGLKAKISLIKDFEWGTNNSPENLNQGLTHCFFVSFASEKDRDAYLIHPAHKDFVKLLQPSLDKVTVIDYWAKQ